VAGAEGETQTAEPGALDRFHPEERFRLLVEQTTEYAIFLLDRSGHVSSWNSGARRIKGYREDEILGQHFSKFYRAEDAWKCERALETARQAGRFEDEGWRVRKDGSLFWANVVITRLLDSHGKLVGFGKVTRDLTERHRTEEQLRQSDERFRLLVESVRDYAIFMLDPKGMIATWNVGAQRIKGYSAEEIVGQHFSRFYPEEDVRNGKCEMELERAAQDGRFEDEGWRIRKDGSWFWANVVITSLWDTNGRNVGFAKVTRDLTERRAAEEERQRLGRLARDRIHILSGLSEALIGAHSVEQVGQIVADRLTAFAQADTVTFYVLDEPSASLRLVAERGCNPTVLEQIRSIGRDSHNPTYPIGIGAAEAVWIENSEQYDAYFPSLARLPSEGTRAQSFWCVPLVAENRSLGMLGVGFRGARRFAPEERDFIVTFARQCAQALARALRLQGERAAAALADRLRASLATTLRSIGDALIATNARGNITIMNGVAESLTGWSEAEACGRPLTEVFRIVNEQTRAPAPNPVERVLQTGVTVSLANHTVLISRSGREIPIDDSGAPIRGDAGNVEGVVLVFRDVTLRKREETRRAFLAEATAALAGSLEYERTVACVAELAVPRLADWCAVDLLVEGEPLPKRLAAVHRDPRRTELVNELDRRYPPDPNAIRGVPNVLRTGRSELHAEITDELLASRSVDAERPRIARELGIGSAMVVPLTALGRVLGAITLVAGDSGRKYDANDLALAEELAERSANAIENARAYRSEQQARRAADLANRAKDEFLAIVSHELRTPLNAIMGWAKMLNSPSLDETRRKSALETIERNSVAMAQLIEDLLDMSRVISGKLRIEMQQVDLARTIHAAIESIRPAALAKGIEIVIQVEPDVPEMMGDPTRLQQIVWNLLSNAVKFTAKGGRVEVGLGRDGPSLELWVSDNGKGIAPAFLRNVFEPFRQEDASPTRSRGGLGLGLAITRQLVELHGGQITVSSAGEGHGAVFSVMLPTSAPVPVVRVSERTGRKFRTDQDFERPEQIRGLHVLVVDDDDDGRGLVATVLEDCGCRVTTASSVEDALKKFSEEVPDLVLSDISMPREDGYHLIRMIRALPHDRGGDVPAAALTAYARAEDRSSLLNAGYTSHLPKPVEPAELVAVVATLSRFTQRPEKHG
jgi:PAS domain S-box-containing protein